MTKTLQQHPLSAAFPEMPESDFQALKDSIENIGVQNPITLYEGMVIDGWHRYRAACELGEDCPSVDLGDIDPQDFVLAQNKARRHITQSQLALAASAVYAWKKNGTNRHSSSALSAELEKSAKEIAEAAGVSTRTVEQAKKVQTNAAPEVVEAVKRGEIGLVKAEAISKLPKEEQAEAVHKPMPKKEQNIHGISESEINDVMEDESDPWKIIEELQAENDRLTAIVESLEKPDLAAELKKQVELYKLLEIRNNGLMNENKSLSDSLKVSQRLARDLRKLTKEDTNLGIIRYVKNLMGIES